MTSAAVVFTAAGVIYILPTIVALLRHKRNWLAIMLCNLVLGWTVVLWFGILIWALLKDS